MGGWDGGVQLALASKAAVDAHLAVGDPLATSVSGGGRVDGEGGGVMHRRGDTVGMQRVMHKWDKISGIRGAETGVTGKG